MGDKESMGRAVSSGGLVDDHDIDGMNRALSEKRLVKGRTVGNPYGTENVWTALVRHFQCSEPGLVSRRVGRPRRPGSRRWRWDSSGSG